MFSTGIIIFREVLEISLILGIIMAATRDIAGRGRWVCAGIAGGVAGSALVAIFAGRISQAMAGMGQEVFNAAVLGVTALMIGWTVVWMKTYGSEMSRRIRHVGRKVSEGELPLYALAAVVALSMWREGAEIALFMTGILSTRQETLLSISMGGLAGFAAGSAVGALIYLGLIRLSARYVFKVTSGLLILLAAGMSAQAAGYLIAADMLPALASPLWDSSWLIADESVLGRVLHAMAGYTSQPSGMQVMFYLAAPCVIMLLLLFFQRMDVSAGLSR